MPPIPVPEPAITYHANITPPGVLAQPRAIGVARLVAKTRGRLSVIGDLHQAGSSRLLFPRSDAGLTGVLLNTAGGMTGGDRFAVSGTAQDASRLTLTTQAAERVYRAQPGTEARLTTTLRAGAAARIDWLPQETILYDHSALRRSLDVHLAADAVFLAVEPLVFGRAAMGEVLNVATLHDRVRVWRDDALIFADQTRICGPVHALLQSPFTAGGAGAMAAVIYAAPDAEGFLAPLRALLPPACGISPIRPGVLFARLLAADSYELRKILVPLSTTLNRAPLPRVWTL